MPGLFGYIAFKPSNFKCGHRFLKEMMQPLVHFKTYQVNTHDCGRAGAGTVAIPGCWGFEQDGDIWAVYFGDLYDITDDDGQYFKPDEHGTAGHVINSFRKYGEHLPEKLAGSYNVFLHDGENNVSYIFNDHFGHKHLYFFQDENVLMFSPEIKTFLKYDRFDKTLDPHGISDYFVYSYQLADRTFFKHVKLLPPASILKIKKNRAFVTSYWRPVYSAEKGKTNIKDTVEQGFHLFEQSVNRRIGKSRKILIPLSGGLDSRLILSIAAKKELDIFTATFGNKKCLDYRIACQVTDLIGLARPFLINIEPTWLRDYAIDLVHLGECAYGALGVTTQHGMAHMIDKKYDIFLNGIYGGHLSFGSPYYNREHLVSDYSPTNRVERIKRGFNGHRYSLLENALTGQVQSMAEAYANETIEQEWERSKNVSDQNALRQDYVFIYNRIRRGMNNINHNIFYFNDRKPFASYALFDFYLSLSPELAINHFLYKEIYKRKLPEFARIPWQQTGLDLFTESSKWLNFKRSLKRNLIWYAARATNGRLLLKDHDQYENHDATYMQDAGLQRWIEDVLLADRCIQRGFYSEKGIFKLLEQEKNGKGLFFEIGKLVMFELWAREFIDEKGVSTGD